MKDSTKWIIAGIGTGLVGVISYGVGYTRGGNYALKESTKSYEKIIDDIFKEKNRQLDELTKTFDEGIIELQTIIDTQRKEYMELWNFLTDDQKKKFIMKHK